MTYFLFYRFCNVLVLVFSLSCEIFIANFICRFTNLVLVSEVCNSDCSLLREKTTTSIELACLNLPDNRIGYAYR